MLGLSFLVHTHLGIWLGTVTNQDRTHATLDACSWVVDQGRMGECVTTGSILESEYLGNGVRVPIAGSIFVPWRHDLPTVTI